MSAVHTYDRLLRLDAVGRDVGFERVDLRVLRVAKVEDLWRGLSTRREVQQHTVQQLVDEDKVVLDAVLVELAKVAAANLDDAVAKLEDERRRGVRLADCGRARSEASGRSGAGMRTGDEVDILVSDVEEARRAERDDG